jgi:hypothetical protein
MFYNHRPKSEATKAKMSAAKMGNTYARGRKLSDEHKAKIAKARTGKKHSPETIAKMSAAKKGKPSMGQRGNHKRWHVNRGLVKTDCTYCNEGVK